MKLSIVTINFNNKRGLIQTIKSVTSQQWSDFEYIIVDGGSTDGSKEVIMEVSSKLSYWQSKPDKGIYNAMNIGLERATGEYLLFLNSGDCLTEDALKKVFSQEVKEEIIYGDIIYQNDVEPIRMPDVLDLKYFLYNSIGHNGTFIKNALFKKIGHYDESYKIISDWVFFMVAIVNYDASYKHIPETITTYSDFGVSRTHYDLIGVEKKNAFVKYFPSMASVFLHYIELNDRFEYLRNRRFYKIYKFIKSKF